MSKSFVAMGKLLGGCGCGRLEEATFSPQTGPCVQTSRPIVRCENGRFEATLTLRYYSPDVELSTIMLPLPPSTFFVSLVSFLVPSVPCPFLLGWIAIRRSTPFVGSPFGLQPTGKRTNDEKDPRDQNDKGPKGPPESTGHLFWETPSKKSGTYRLTPPSGRNTDESQFQD